MLSFQRIKQNHTQLKDQLVEGINENKKVVELRKSMKGSLAYSKRPKTSNILLSSAERMPWPGDKEGRVR
jgi:hypothetical protein